MSLSLVQAATPTLNTLSIAFSSNITPGNSVVVCMSRNNGWTAPITISGNGNALTLAKQSANNETRIYYYSGVGASPGATITAASGAAVLYAYEVSGTITLDQAVTTVTGSGTTWTLSTGTLAQAIEFGVGIVYGNAGPSSIGGPISPWTNEAQQANAATSGYQITSATTAITYSGTFGSPSTADICVCTFYSASVSFSGSPTQGTVLTASASGAKREASTRTQGTVLTASASGTSVRHGSASTSMAVTPGILNLAITGVTLAPSMTGYKSVTAAGGGYRDTYNDNYGYYAQGISSLIAITPSSTGSVGGASFSGSPAQGITLTPSSSGSVVPFSSSRAAGVTLTPSATGSVPFNGTPSQGVILVASALGTKVAVAAAAAGTVLTPLPAGGKASASAPGTGTALSCLAAGVVSGTAPGMILSISPTGGTDKYGIPFPQGIGLGFGSAIMTNVLSVLDGSQNKMAGFDADGNLVAQVVNAVDDVVVAGQSVNDLITSMNAFTAQFTAFEAMVNAYIAVNPGNPPPPPPPTTYTEYFYPFATSSWYYNNGSPTLKNNGSTLFHGYWGNASQWEFAYINWASGSLGHGVNTVLNYDVQSVKLRLTNLHTWYSSGMRWGLHDSTTWGGGQGYYSVIRNPGGSTITEGGTQNYTLSGPQWAPLKAAGTTYTVLSPDSADVNNFLWYGYFAGQDAAVIQRPLLTVVYKH